MCFQNATSLIGRLSHVSIATSDIDKASAFYKNLGAKVSEKVAHEEYGVYTAYVELPNTKLELFCPLKEKIWSSFIQGFLERDKMNGIHHICLQVKDINQKQGIRKLSKEASSGAPAKLPIFLNPEDCGGVLIELEQE
ncbi:unnamed protein product [Gongylonema pulchrum]|uniref:VOC domain-containing protein n=1 Tax=Gongylonema pulchrum TaxID=637853 RepID=A0A183ED36_9BILA|nr:unnamed protein product [Gongylonema pulchrum]